MAADGLKQRLVGGATLLLVAVIAWFWLLSADSPVDPVARESQIPAAPDIQPFAVQEPSAPQGVEPIGSENNSEPALQSDVVPKGAAQGVSQGAPQKAPGQTAQPVAAISTATNTAKTTPTASVAAKTTAANAVAANTTATGSAAAKALPPKTVPKPQPNVAAARVTPTAPVATKTEAKPVPKTAKDSKLAAETFQLDQHGLPIAWVVQVGLFSTQTHADKIKATLQQNGFKAYTESFKSDKASGIKVFVGPKLSRERADTQKRAIDQLLKTNTMVVRFAAN